MEKYEYETTVKATKIVEVEFKFTSDTPMNMGTFSQQREEAYAQFREQHPELSEFGIYIQEIHTPNKSSGAGVITI